MIKCTDFKVERYGTSNKVVLASLDADTKEEVVAMGNIATNVIGLKDGDEISFGSTCVTSSLDVGKLNSSGSWVF